MNGTNVTDASLVGPQPGPSWLASIKDAVSKRSMMVQTVTIGGHLFGMISRGVSASRPAASLAVIWTPHSTETRPSSSVLYEALCDFAAKDRNTKPDTLRFAVESEVEKGKRDEDFSSQASSWSSFGASRSGKIESDESSVVPGVLTNLSRILGLQKCTLTCTSAQTQS
jgi:hypothetical protein